MRSDKDVNPASVRGSELDGELKAKEIGYLRLLS